MAVALGNLYDEIVVIILFRDKINQVYTYCMYFHILMVYDTINHILISGCYFWNIKKLISSILSILSIRFKI